MGVLVRTALRPHDRHVGCIFWTTCTAARGRAYGRWPLYGVGPSKGPWSIKVMGGSLKEQHVLLRQRRRCFLRENTSQ